MPAMTVELRNVEGTEAAMGWAGGHTLVVDRPPGKAGGQGLGFNGGELLALAIGGCFCNDLRYAAHSLNVRLGKIAVSVTLDLEGDPLLVKSAAMAAICETRDGSSPQAVIERAMAISTVAHSVQKGFPVAINAD